MAEQKRGADGVKTAVLRKGLAGLEFISAAAHAHRYTAIQTKNNMRNFEE